MDRYPYAQKESNQAAVDDVPKRSTVARIIARSTLDKGNGGGRCFFAHVEFWKRFNSLKRGEQE
jgi:hypothetical protein